MPIEQVSKYRGFVFPVYYHEYDYNTGKPKYLQQALIKQSDGMIGATKWPLRKDEVWAPLYKSIDMEYNKRSKILPPGTKLYRGTLENKPNYFYSKDKSVVFFGLDCLISIWYTLEAWEKFNKEKKIPYTKWKGYLHCYKMTKPIKYHYMKDDGATPTDEPFIQTCSKMPCVHPQAILHGNADSFELGTELTIPFSDLDLYGIRYERSYSVDLIKLLQHRNNPFNIWSPIRALI